MSEECRESEPFESSTAFFSGAAGVGSGAAGAAGVAGAAGAAAPVFEADSNLNELVTQARFE